MDTFLGLFVGEPLQGYKPEKSTLVGTLVHSRGRLRVPTRGYTCGLSGLLNRLNAILPPIATEIEVKVTPPQRFCRFRFHMDINWDR